VDYDIKSDSIRRIIGAGDVLLTSRYHAMISGLSLAVPTAVIGWGHKYRETMAYFDLQEYSLNFSDHSVDLERIVKELLDKKSAIQRKIKKHLPEVRALSETQFEYLARVLS
jgi:colanic acid/amylovoran biosynthesis protein